jgi:transaldolase
MSRGPPEVLVPVSVGQHQIKLFADGADVSAIRALAGEPVVDGFTTNPTLMRKAGVESYERFAREVLSFLNEQPLSLEVFSDDADEMVEQARKMSSWGPNVYVKIPVTNTLGQFSGRCLMELAGHDVKVNVTALMTVDQVVEVTDCLRGGPPAFVSVFAGRIADTGLDPVPRMAAAAAVTSSAPNTELIWASSREVLNIVQAATAGCHIITVTNDLIAKLALFGRDLTEYSLETVQMFYDDARAAGFTV